MNYKDAYQKYRGRYLEFKYQDRDGGSKDSREVLSIIASDGIKLSAVLYRSNMNRPSTTVISIDPYRGQTYNWRLHNELGRFLQRNGYNYVMMDVRGTGQSEGIATDEYSKDEQRDTKTLIDFIIRQTNWSNSKIVMYGLSYSAFTALQAIPNSEHIVSAFVMHGTDNRWKTDIHWFNGVKTVTDWLQYATAMIPFNIMPNIRTNLKESIKNNERLKTNKPWVNNWFTRDPSYWKNGSISLSYDIKKINIPIFLYGGFHDLYIDAMVRLHNRLPNNITMISDQGHDYPRNRNELLLWWLNNYEKVNGKTAYYLPQGDSNLGTDWIKMDESNSKITLQMNKGGVIPNKFICGVLFRNNSKSACKISLKDQLQKRALAFPLYNISKIQPDMYMINEPIISIDVNQIPDDFYLVTWLLDNDGYIYSTGVMRWIKSTSNRLTIVMSPICISLNKINGLCLYIGMSNLPNLIPQFWVKEPIEIYNCAITIELSKGLIPEKHVPLPDNCLYIDNSTPTTILFDPINSILNMSYKQTGCLKTDTCDMINGYDCECDDEMVDIVVTKNRYHAKFSNRVKLYDKNNDSLTIHSVTNLRASDKIGILSVKLYESDKKVLDSVKKFDL